MRKRLSSFCPCCCGGANGDFGFKGEKPKNKKVLTRLLRSGRSLRMQSTTPSQSNFSSANSRSDRNDCLLASCVKVFGKTTYKMLLSWSKTCKEISNKFFTSILMKFFFNSPNPNWTKSCQWRGAWWWCESVTFVRQSARWTRLHHHFHCRCYRSSRHQLRPSHPHYPLHQWMTIVVQKNQQTTSPLTQSQKMSCERNQLKTAAYRDRFSLL